MRSLPRRSLASLVLLVGCTADLPEGQYECTSDDRCPPGWHCRWESAWEGGCYRGAADEECLLDEDGDGVARCSGGVDCDDHDPRTFPGSMPGVPGALEICDGVDNDCDGALDEFARLCAGHPAVPGCLVVSEYLDGIQAGRQVLLPLINRCDTPVTLTALSIDPTGSPDIAVSSLGGLELSDECLTDPTATCRGEARFEVDEARSFSITTDPELPSGETEGALLIATDAGDLRFLITMTLP